MKISQTALMVLSIVIIGFFLRILNLYTNLHFTGDEGRDALVALNIVRFQEFPLLGPGSSIGDINLGPLYYYLIAPFSLLGAHNPSYLAIPVILFSTATIFLIYWAGVSMFTSKLPGILGAALFAVSPASVMYGRWSWNPNIMPFFALLFMISLYKSIEKKEKMWIICMALSFSVMIQSHYVALSVLISALILFIKERKEIPIDKFLPVLGFSTIIFLVSLSPLIIYDISRNFRNFRGFFNLLTSGGGGSFLDFPLRLFINLGELFGSFLGIYPLMGLVFVGIVYLTLKRKTHSFFYIFILGGIIGLTLIGYELEIHYYQFLWPALALLLGSLFSTLFVRGLSGKLLFGFTLLILLLSSLQIAFDNDEPTVSGIKEVVHYIKESASGSEFNFAVLSEDNREDSYQYFFELADIPYSRSTPLRQLFVICEGEIECNPRGHPKYEIALFEVRYNGQVVLESQSVVREYYQVLKFVPLEE